MTGTRELLLGVLWVALVTATWFAWRRGGEPERFAATLVLSQNVLSWLFHRLFGLPNFLIVRPEAAVLDSWLLLMLVWLALNANRIWPFVATGLQTIVVIGHLAKAFDAEMVRKGYWAIVAVPSYLMIVTLLIGTASQARRTRRLGRPVRDWRPPLPRLVTRPPPAESAREGISDETFQQRPPRRGHHPGSG